MSERIETRQHSIIVSRCKNCHHEEIHVVNNRIYDNPVLGIIWKKFKESLWIPESIIQEETHELSKVYLKYKPLQKDDVK